MYKVAVISFVFLLLGSGCSVLRKNSPRSVEQDSKEVDKELINNDILESNISNNGFYIKRAELEIISGGEKENAVLSIKRSLAGNYQVSLRSRAGIEVARAFLDKDTILVNQRLDRLLLFGEPDVLLKKYGFSYNLIPLIFGDIILNSESVLSLNCVEGQANAEVVYGRMRLVYLIDCDLKKAESIRVDNDRTGVAVDLTYKMLKSSQKTLIPAIVRISFRDMDMTVTMEIKEIEIPWDGATGIIPGENYERVEIK